MPAADIEINAVASGGVDVPINVPVQLSNADVGGETTYAWQILDQPEGAADALSSPAIENPTFTPRKEGSYLIRLVVNASTPTEAIDTAVVSVVEFRTGERLPAAGELLERDTVRGWATAVNRQLRRVDRLRGDAGIIAATATAGMAVGSIVRLSSAIDTLKAGLPGEEIVPRAALLGAASAYGLVGVIVAVCDGGSIAAGKLVLVRVSGLVEFTEAGAPVVGDLVYVDNAGEPTLTATSATHPRLVGRVVWTDGANYRWVINGFDGRWAIERRTTNPTEGVAGAGWAIAGGTTGDLSWSTTTAPGTALLMPIHAGPQEVIYRVEAVLQQGSTTSLVDATLTRGTATPGGGAVGNAVTSAGTAGAQTLNVAPGAGALVLPYQLDKNEIVWCQFGANGANGTDRRVGAITAFVRPI
jgi:hypothetical protein